jgi:WD40 repeat protein
MSWLIAVLGVSDTSGICTIQMPDTLVVCFTLNNQSIEGAASVTQGVFEQRAFQDSHSSLSQRDSTESSATIPERFYLSPYQFKIFPVPMRVDQAEQDKLGIRRTYSRRKFDKFLERMPVIDRRKFWGAVSVPYVPYFSYEEILATFKDEPSDPNTCLAAFTRIATEITENDVTGFIPLISPEQRDAVLQEFAKVPISEPARASDDNRVQGRDGTTAPAVTAAGTGSIESAETQVESSLRHAEATFQSLTVKEREQARLLWMRLVRIPRPGEYGENSKVRVPLKDIPMASTPVIQKFANAGVITVGKDDKTQESTAEVNNEELLRSWPTLDQWIQDDRYLLLWRQDLQASMTQWQQRGRKWDDLLTGRRLLKSREWYKTHRQHLSNNEAAYIEASFKWVRNVVMMAAVLAVALIGVLVYLQTRSDKTKLAANIASSAQSEIDASTQDGQLLPDRFQRGLLLATEAQQLASSAAATDILRNNLARLPRRSSSFDIRNNVLDLALSPNGSQVLAVTGTPRSAGPLEDRAAQLNDVSNGATILRVPFERGSRTFKLSSDASYVAVVSAQGETFKVNVIEAATGKNVAAINHDDEVYDMAFSPDGNYIATGSGDKSVRVTNLRAPLPRAPFRQSYRGAVNAVRFSGNSQHLAVSGEDFMVHVLRNIPSAQRFSDSRNIEIGSTAFQTALSNDGRYLATVTLDNRMVSLWDVESEKLITKYEISRGAVYPVWFTPDNRFLLAAAEGTVYVWPLTTGGKDANTIPYDTGNAITYSDDGKYFAAFGREVARVWEYDGSSFKEIASLIHKSNVLRLTFGNPNLAVTGGVDNFITVWTLGGALSDNLRNEACSRLTRNLTIEEWNSYLPSSLGPYRKTCPEIP